MRSQPLSSAASQRRAEEQFKTKKKVDSADTPPHSKPRWRKPRACARFGWPRKQPTRRQQIATRRQRRPLDLRRAGAFEDSGFKSVGTQVRVLWRPAPEGSVRLPARLFLFDAVADRRG